jgi:hypothetical protein
LQKKEIQDQPGATADFKKTIEYSNQKILDNRIDSKSPNLQYYRYYRGLARIALGQKDDGCLDLSKAGEFGYEDAYEMIKTYCH